MHQQKSSWPATQALSTPSQAILVPASQDSTAVTYISSHASSRQQLYLVGRRVQVWPLAIFHAKALQPATSGRSAGIFHTITQSHGQLSSQSPPNISLEL